MKKNFESRIPKPVASKTDSIRSNESSSSNHERKSHVQFNTESLNFSELRIKLIGEDPPLSKTTRGRSEVKSKAGMSSSNSSRSRRSSKSPQQKHKILVYEPEKAKATKVISPYMCDINRKEDSNAAYKEIYVSDREFKLLKNAADLQQAADRRVPMNRFEKTLFGYVTLPEAPVVSAVSGTDPSKKSSSTTKQNQQQLPQSRKTNSQTAMSRRSDEKKKPRSQRESSVSKTQGQVPKTQSSEYASKANRHGSRQNTSTSDNFTLTNAWEDDLVDSDSKMEEYRMFVEKFKERFNKPYSECASSPIYQSPPAVAIETISQESQTDTAANTNGNLDKNFSCDLIPQDLREDLRDPAQKSLGEVSSEVHSKFSSSVLETVSSDWKELCRSSSHSRVPSLADRMKRSVMIATETSLVLMNTLFKDALQDPKSSARLVDSNLFQKFINVETEVEALEKAATIFEAANKSIVGYLQTLNRSTAASSIPQDSLDFGDISEIPLGVSQVQDQTLLDAKQSLDSTDSRALQEKADVKTPMVAKPESISNLAFGDSETLTQWSYSSDMDKKPLQMTMSTAHEPGFLVQNITCKDFEFHLNFVGTTRKVSSLISSTRSKTKTIALTPFQLLDIIDRCLTHLAVRLGSTNLHLQLSSQHLGAVVKDYTDGRHGHYSKSLKKSNLKLQGLNIFAGIVLQITRVTTKISEKLLSSMNVLLKLQEVLKDKDKAEAGSDGGNAIEVEPPSDALLEIVTVLDELENAMEIGRNSLAAIYSKSSSEVKMKKSLRDILDELFQALLELDTQDYIDFGSLLMSAVTCTGMLCGCSGKPRFDPTVQRNVFLNLNKMNVNILELQGTSKRMNFVSGYLASKSLLNLKNNREAAKLLEEKQSQIKNIPWYKRRLFSRVLERTYSMISIPSPVAVLSEDEGDLHLNNTTATDSSHYSTASAENESPNISNSIQS